LAKRDPLISLLKSPDLGRKGDFDLEQQKKERGNKYNQGNEERNRARVGIYNSEKRRNSPSLYLDLAHSKKRDHPNRPTKKKFSAGGGRKGQDSLAANTQSKEYLRFSIRNDS